MAQHKAPDVIVFDMDGVLVEVSASYRETIRETVKHFTGKLISPETIQDYKNAGGWNNDWALSQKLIQEQGKDVAYGDVVTHFNAVFFGENNDGLINQEEWLPTPGLLEDLSKQFRLAIFTGRVRQEADVTLNRFAKSIPFEPIVTADVVKHEKPAPDGLITIINHYPGKHIWYLGDTVDDARSAQAAKVPFIGIAAPANPRHSELVYLLESMGAIAVLEDINQLASLVAERATA